MRTAYTSPATSRQVSVDAFLHVLEDAGPGAVLVVDNGGRDDGACVGDLIALELREAGMAGAVLWDRHRDTAQLLPCPNCGGALERSGSSAHPYWSCRPCNVAFLR